MTRRLTARRLTARMRRCAGVAGVVAAALTLLAPAPTVLGEPPAATAQPHAVAAQARGRRSSASSKCKQLERRAKRAHRKSARKRLMAKYRHCVRRHRGQHPTKKGQGGKQGTKRQAQKRADQKVQKLIGNLELSGTVAQTVYDPEVEVDDIYCANGGWHQDHAINEFTEWNYLRSEGRRWWVEQAQIHGSEFTAGLFAEEADKEVAVNVVRKRSNGRYEYRIWGYAVDASKAESEYRNSVREIEAKPGKVEGWTEVEAADATEKCSEMG